MGEMIEKSTLIGLCYQYKYLALLLGSYFVYGKIVENTFAHDDREMPAVRFLASISHKAR